MDIENTSSSDPIPHGKLVTLPVGSELVTDADEEIFLLYTRLAGETSGSSSLLGLGSVDSKLSEITVSFVLEPPPTLAHEMPRYSRKKSSTRIAKKEEVTVECTLEQDPSSLRSRSGDTGSVLWRASVVLTRFLLADHHFPTATPFLSPTALKEARVLELGAGIGMLACLLAPIVGHYLATDLKALVPLIRKNVLRCHSGKNMSVTDLDWMQLLFTQPSRRSAVFDIDQMGGSFDLIVCCDCIYNTELVPCLVFALDYCATEKTVVLVVAELREVDVLREFLAAWLSVGFGWEVWRLPESCLDARTVGWVGWKAAQK